MVVLGLIFLVAAAVFGTDIVLENTNGDSSGTIFSQTVSNLSLGGVFLAGAITALVLALGLWLLLGGAARARRRRVAQRQRLREASAQQESLAEEKERLARQLQAERADRAASPVSPYDDDRTRVTTSDGAAAPDVERRGVE